MKKVFVSGSFDMLHSGHVAFFEEAAALGDLYVGIGSSQTIEELKGRKTINTDNERLYMVSAIKFVKQCWISSGSGLLDFEKELRELKPDVFFVNEDGQSPLKVSLCKELGVDLIVSKRIPQIGMPKRSTTDLRKECTIPYRIDLAGGWLDQPYVSKYASGGIITISIEPDYEFNDRAGMSTSTRQKAIELWQTSIPSGDRKKLAKTLFCFENPPGKDYVSGSQDALGIVMPGINKLHYTSGEYWPSEIESIEDDGIVEWLEERIKLIPLSPRTSDLRVTDGANITEESVLELANASEALWNALKAKDAQAFGLQMLSAFNAQVKLFPAMVNDEIIQEIATIKDECLGYKMSGAGGGGYLVVFTETPMVNAMDVRVRLS